MSENTPEVRAEAMPVLDTERPDVNEFMPSTEHESASRAIGSAQASSEVLGAIYAAKRFPRDEYKSFQKVITACQRISLANAATYMYPRGGQNVTGPSIRLAEVLAQAWGNLDYGIRELEQHEGFSEMQAYCWDLETNLQRKINFTVKHERHTRQGSYELSDPRDIYEMTANQGARRMRACILALIPADVTEKAVAMCKQTIAKGAGEPLEDLIKKMIIVYKQFGVTQDMIEQKLGHPLSEMSPEEYADYRSICNTIRDNHGSRDQFFATTASSKPVINAPKGKQESKPAGKPAKSAQKQQAPAKTAKKQESKPAKPQPEPEAVPSPAETELDTADLREAEEQTAIDTSDDAIAEHMEAQQDTQAELPLKPPVQKSTGGQAVAQQEVPSGQFQIEASKRVAALGWNAEMLSTFLQENFNAKSLIEIPLKSRVLVLASLKELLNGQSG